MLQDLADSLTSDARELAAVVRARINVLGNIRRRCMVLVGSAATRCWWEYRVEVLFGITDTIRYVQEVVKLLHNYFFLFSLLIVIFSLLL